MEIKMLCFVGKQKFFISNIIITFVYDWNSPMKNIIMRFLLRLLLFILLLVFIRFFVLFTFCFLFIVSPPLQDFVKLRITSVVTKAYFLSDCVHFSWLRIRLIFYASFIRSCRNFNKPNIKYQSYVSEVKKNRRIRTRNMLLSQRYKL